MLTDKFLPQSYYDIMLYTYVVPYETEKDETKRYKFVVNKQGMYDGRGMNLFSQEAVDGKIPNDMQLVISKLREFLN